MPPDDGNDVHDKDNQVFISYSRHDARVAQRLASDLNSAGVSTWSADDIQLGSTWREEISQNLGQAKAMVVLVSLDSLESKSVREEWLTYSEKSKRIIPALVGGARISDLPRDFALFQAVDLTSDYKEGVDRIVSTLEYLEQSDQPPVSGSVDLNDLVRDIVKQRLDELGISKTSPERRDDATDNELVFVVTSFQADMEPAFEAIKCAAEKVGLRAERVKDVPGDYRITEKMIQMIHAAYLIVVDLTHERPNVYFELGYARSLGKRIVTIVREGYQVHFDIYDWTYLRYADSRPLEKDLIQRFEYELSQDGRSIPA